MWKAYLGKCIYESPSGFRVWQNFGYRWLTFEDNVFQSIINRRYPEYGGLQYITPFTRMVHAFPGDCCLLGLGGASVAHALFKTIANSQLDAVDNSQEVIDIATRFFKTDRVKNLNIIHQNAETFVQSTSMVYQHLLVDLYNANDYPLECSHDAFFANCKAILKPGGMMAVNLIDIHEKKHLVQYIKNQFNNCTLLVPVVGTTNTIVFAYNGPKTGVFLEKINPVMKSVVWDSVWGCVGQISM